MKEFSLPLLVVLVLFIAALIVGYQYGTPYLNPYLENKLTGMAIRDIGIDIIVADTPALREKGLSGKMRLPDDAGMLFIFDSSEYHGIWMKDMNFPIDVIWIDENLRIVDITESLQPDSYPTVYEPKAPARIALEVNALFAATNKIKVGEEVRIADEYLPADLKNR